MRKAYRSPWARLPFALITLTILASCIEDVVIPTAPPVSQSIVVVDADVQDAFRGESEFVALATDHPAFAGYFLEGDELVVLASIPSERAAVRMAVEGRIRTSRTLLASVTDISVRDATFSFFELAGWRNLVLKELAATQGLVSLDLDERHNRIVLGVTSEADPESISEWFLRHQIPAAAVLVKQRRPFQPAQQHLDQHNRPARGGLGVEVYDNQGFLSLCSVGFVARRFPWGSYNFVTNSHCGRDFWGVDPYNTKLFQHQGTASSHRIGLEWLDPYGWACWGPSVCRKSDAAMHSTTLPDDSVGFGRIARTTFRRTGGLPGSTVITSPDFSIVGVQNYPIMGQEVNKMGAAGGWTYGNVDQTCVAQWLAIGHRAECQYHAGYRSDPGDSGAPVFAWTGGNTVTFLGINHSNDGEWGTAGTGNFSPWQGLQDDLGQMQVWNAPLQGSIQGPTTAPSEEQCTWYATNVSGGAWPYSYQWSGVLSGSNNSVTGIVQEPGGWLYLTVTDAQSNQLHDQLYLEVDEFGFCDY